MYTYRNDYYTNTVTLALDGASFATLRGEAKEQFLAELDRVNGKSAAQYNLLASYNQYRNY